MEFKELKKKNEADLHKVLAEYRAKLRDLRFKDANKQLKNVREIRSVKLVIAQTLTLLNVLKNSKETAKNKVESDKKSEDKK